MTDCYFAALPTGNFLVTFWTMFVSAIFCNPEDDFNAVECSQVFLKFNILIFSLVYNSSRSEAEGLA